MPETKRAERATQIPIVLADPEYLSRSLPDLQALRLTRLCAISLAMAEIVAPMLHDMTI